MGIDILFSKTVFSWWNNIISWIILREMYSRWKGEYHSDLWTRTLTIWIYKYMCLGINSYLYLTAAWEWKKQFTIYENKFKYLYMLLGFLLEFALSLGVARKELRTRGTFVHTNTCSESYCAPILWMETTSDCFFFVFVGTFIKSAILLPLYFLIDRKTDLNITPNQLGITLAGIPLKFTEYLIVITLNVLKQKWPKNCSISMSDSSNIMLSTESD